MEDIKKIEQSITKKFKKTIWCRFIGGIKDYALIQKNDKIAVCISGGKDSMLLAKCMELLCRHSEFTFELEFIVMDPGYNQENRARIVSNAEHLQIPIHIFDSDIFRAVEHIENTPCYLCARMRRGFLYKYAQSLGCNKIALGHHFDDVIETILMGMLYGAQIQTMMPKLHSTNHPGMELIRPFYLVRERDILAWKSYNQLDFIQCACRLTEGLSQAGETGITSKRQEMKELIQQLRKVNSNIDINIFRSIHNVNLDTIIGYHNDKMQYNFLDDYDSK